MKHLTAVLFSLALLAACGADGDPVPPSLSGEVSIGYSSQKGMVSGADVGICLGPSCQ